MGAVVHPITSRANPLASGDGGGMANNGDQVTVTTCLDPNDTKAVLGVLVSDPLNQPGKNFSIG
jgi:hypothetical protein